MEIDLIFNYDYPGVSPLNLFYKMKVIERNRLHFSVSITHNIGNETFDLNSILSYEVDKFAVNLNFGSIDRFNSICLGLSPIYNLSEKITVGADMNSIITSKTLDSANIMFGVTFLPFEKVAVDAGIVKDVKNNSSIGLTGGITADF